MYLNNSSSLPFQTQVTACHHLSQGCPLAMMQFNGESKLRSIGLILFTSIVQTEAQEGLDLTRSPPSWGHF